MPGGAEERPRQVPQRGIGFGLLGRLARDTRTPNAPMQERDSGHGRAKSEPGLRGPGGASSLTLVAALEQTTSREILLWMTPSEAPKALQASECSELLDPTRANCWISAQHQPGKFTGLRARRSDTCSATHHWGGFWLARSASWGAPALPGLQRQRRPGSAGASRRGVRLGAPREAAQEGALRCVRAPAVPMRD